MAVRAIRGAITVEANSAAEILSGAKELLSEIFNKNELQPDDLISIIFTLTHDLDAAFPAVAAREMGLMGIALMCMNEINVPNSLKKCIRVMLHTNTEKGNGELKHIYLKGAKVLRPDLAE